MASISCNELGERLLAHCLKGERSTDDLLEKLISPACSDALFGVVAEGLADRFEPRLCDAYAEMFSQVIERSLAEQKAAWPSTTTASG